MSDDTTSTAAHAVTRSGPMSLMDRITLEKDHAAWAACRLAEHNRLFQSIPYPLIDGKMQEWAQTHPEPNFSAYVAEFDKTQAAERGGNHG